MVLLCWYWNCSPLFKVSFHKHCTANPLSPMYSPSTIPWIIFHLLIYTQHDHNMSWILHRRDVYRYSGIGPLLARNTGIPLFRICEFISHILEFEITDLFLCSRIRDVSVGCLEHILILYENVSMFLSIAALLLIKIISNFKFRKFTSMPIVSIFESSPLKLLK